MADIMIYAIEQRFFDFDSGTLLMKWFRQLPMEPKYFNNLDYFNLFKKMKVGETMNFRFEKFTIDAFKCRAPEKILKLAFTPNTPIVPGTIVIPDSHPDQIARITKISGIWAEVEFFPAWLKGKRVNLETTLLGKRAALATEDEAYFKRAFLEPVSQPC